MLGVSAHGFEEARNNGRGIDSFFGAGSAKAAAAVPSLARREEGGATNRPLPALSAARNPLGFAVDSEAVVVETRAGAGEGDKRRRAAGEATAFGGVGVAVGAHGEGQGGDGVDCSEEVIEVEALVADAGEAMAAGLGDDAVEGVVEDRSRSGSVEKEEGEEEDDGLAEFERWRGGRSGASEAVVDLTTARGGGVLGVEEQDRRRCDAEGEHETIVERDESLALRQRRGGGGAGLGEDGGDERGRLHGTGYRDSGACGADGRHQDHYCCDKGDEKLGGGVLARDPQMEAAARCGAGGGVERGGSGVEKRETPSKADGPRGRAMFESGGASGLLGKVDPDVLAELPVEIRREIWMQQVISNSVIYRV